MAIKKAHNFVCVGFHVAIVEEATVRVADR